MDNPELASVPESWLRGEHLSAAERVDRLSGDTELASDLKKNGFQGPGYDEVKREITKYGFAVIFGWIRRGVIQEKCQEKGLRGPPFLPHDLDNDSIEEITGETVAKALNHFRTDVLLKDRWIPARGASLRTFFVGQCLIRYINVANAWMKHERPVDRLDIADDELDHALGATAVSAVEDDAIQVLAATDALRAVKNHQARIALSMQALKYTHPEIAQHLGTSTKAVERMIANERARLRKDTA